MSLQRAFGLRNVVPLRQRRRDCSRLKDVTEDGNIDLRVESIGAGLEVVAKKPITGVGLEVEEKDFSTCISSPIQTARNQYISWMIWGGVPALVSGLLFLLAPAVAAWGVRDRFGPRVLILAALGPLSLIADTFMRLELYLQMQCLITAIMAAIAFDGSDGRAYE